MLLAGAYLSEYGFGLFPCDICWWQRYPHIAGIVFALAAGISKRPKSWLWIAAVSIAISGTIGGWHAGIEYGWWEGMTACTSMVAKGGDPLEAILNAPIIRCDEAAWTLFGISLAGWNFLFSFAGAAAIMALLKRKER